MAAAAAAGCITLTVSELQTFKMEIGDWMRNVHFSNVSHGNKLIYECDTQHIVRSFVRSVGGEWANEIVADGITDATAYLSIWLKILVSQRHIPVLSVVSTAPHAHARA